MVKVDDVYGRLRVIKPDVQRSEEIKNKKYGRKFWVCECECGRVVSVRNDALTRKNQGTRSCGCLQRDTVANYMRKNPPQAKYGESRERIHNIWYLMCDRCLNPQSPAYINYGARGISVCSEWADGIEGYFRFKQWATENGYTSELTIDRINNDGNYCPENCRWISKCEQASNKRANVYIEWNGEKKTIAQWARELGMDMKTLHRRLTHLHWPIEKAMTEPLRKRPTLQQHV